MTTVIANYLKFANLQMAAEALYDLKTAPAGSTAAGEISAAMLTVGNERSSKFTKVQADEFVKDWTVVEHISNTKPVFQEPCFVPFARTSPEVSPRANSSSAFGPPN